MTEPQPPIDNPSARSPKAPTPAQFLDELQTAEPGWSQAYGGPDGVIALTGDLLETLSAQSHQIAAVRTAAIRAQLRTEAATTIAARHHISRQAVSKAATATRTWKGETW